MRRRSAAAMLAVVLGAALAGPPAPSSSQEVAPPRLTVTVQDNPATTVLVSVSFPDALHGFAVAANNSFFTTVDGGRTWVEGRTVLPVVDFAVPRPEGVNGFTDVDFTDPEHGYAVTLDGNIIATADGGKSWVVQKTPTPSEVPATWPLGTPAAWSFNAVSFVDRQSGFVVGNPGLILATSDGGASWQYQGKPDYDRLTDVSFLDTDHGRIVGHVTGPDEDAFLALNTIDGGRTWTPQKTGKPGDSNIPINFEAVAATEPRHAVVVGRFGRIFITFDAGKTWRNRRSGTLERLNSVAFADRRRGLAVGEVEFQGELRAQILSTNDGGQNWFQRPTPEAASLSEVTFADSTTAFAVGCVTAVGTCRQGAILKIDFPELELEVEQPSSSGFSPVPLILVGMAVVIAGGGVLLSRRR